MSMIKLDPTRLAILADLANMPGQIMALRSMYEAAQLEWNKLKNTNGGAHLIESVTVSAAKTDAVNVYMAKLSKLFMNSVGSYMHGHSLPTLLTKNDELIQMKNWLAGSVNLTHEKAFAFIASNMYGYDNVLLNIVMTTNKDIQRETEGTLRYIVNRHNLSEGYIPTKEGESPTDVYMELTVTPERVKAYALNREAILTAALNTNACAESGLDTMEDVMIITDMHVPATEA